jgi:hypothetical protein
MEHPYFYGTALDRI